MTRVRLQVRRDTAARWLEINPVLLEGEPGYEEDTGFLKFGDGVTHWDVLGYYGGSGAGGTYEIEDINGLGELLGDIQTDISTVASTPGPKGKTLLVAEFPTPTTGETSQMFHLPESVSSIFPFALQADTAPIGGAVQVDLEADSGLGFAPVTASPGSLAAGSTWAVSGPITTASLAANSRLRFKVVSAPATASANLTRLATPGTTNSDTNAITSVTVQAPAGIQNGDLILAFIGRQSPLITGVPAGWTNIVEQVTDPTTVQARLSVYWATYNTSLNRTFTLASGSPVITHTIGFSGHNQSNPIDLAVSSGGNNAGAVRTIAAATTGQANTRVLYVALGRYGATDEGRVRTWTGPTSVADALSNRGTTNTDIGMAIAEITSKVTASGTAVPSATVGDVTGTSFTSWANAIVSVREGVSSGSAGRLAVQVMVR